MSDHIPFELQEEIIRRIPVKSLLRFRSVSKQWKSVIDSPDFADDYCALQSQPHRLLIRCDPLEEDEHFTTLCFGPIKHIRKCKYVSVADDDDTFQQHQIPSTTLPKSINNFEQSHGLVCLCGSDYRDGSPMVVLWNLWIRKFVDVPVPNFLFDPSHTVFGFGVSPQTKDPMIVKINNCTNPQADTSVCFPWQVEVFSLSSGTWKSQSCSGNNLPCRDSIRFCWGQVALDGVIYWLAYELIKVDGRFRYRNLIMSFDLSSEGFQEVRLPDYLARLSHYDLYISKRMESVVVLEDHATSCDVWMMGQGVTKSFTKLFTVMLRVPSYCVVRGFMKNGEPIVENGSDALFAYDPYSERIKDLGIVGKRFTLFVDPYMETLLLIDQ